MLCKVRYIGKQGDWLYGSYWFMEIHPNFFMRVVITKTE